MQEFAELSRKWMAYRHKSLDVKKMLKDFGIRMIDSDVCDDCVHYADCPITMDLFKRIHGKKFVASCKYHESDGIERDMD